MSPESGATALGAWLDRHTARAPQALRARVREYAGEARGGRLPDSLAAAGRSALARVLAHPGDRSAALDLLAADALVTLALLAQAEEAPAQLGAFGERLVRTELAES
jgi:hypothetical protein